MIGFRTLPRSTGRSPAAKRIIAAGEAFQRAKAGEGLPKCALPTPPAPPLPKPKGSPTINGAVLALVESASSAGPDRPPLFVQVDRISRDACALFKVKRREITGGVRTRNIVMPRMYVAQRLKDETALSLPQIGQRLGGRDHTTILHATHPDQRARVAEYIADLDRRRGA